MESYRYDVGSQGQQPDKEHNVRRPIASVCCALNGPCQGCVVEAGAQRPVACHAASLARRWPLVHTRRTNSADIRILYRTAVCRLACRVFRLSRSTITHTHTTTLCRRECDT